MKQMFLFGIALLMVSGVWSQTDAEIVKDIETYRVQENEKFKDVEESPLELEDLKKFESLDFYPIDLAYRVKAKFVRTPNEKPFLMLTTTNRLPEYVKYGEVHFVLKGKKLKLSLFQNTDHRNHKGYEDHLFLPFTDLTSGDGSYGGGRYVDAWIPESDTMIIDFNKAYNPYCVYSKEYSCPLTPKENDLMIRVEAGVRDYEPY